MADKRLQHLVLQLSVRRSAGREETTRAGRGWSLLLPDQRFSIRSVRNPPPPKSRLTCENRLLVAGGLDAADADGRYAFRFSVRKNHAGQRGCGKLGGRCGRYFLLNL